MYARLEHCKVPNERAVHAIHYPYLLLLCHQLCNAGLSAVSNCGCKLLKDISHLQHAQSSTWKSPGIQ